jgi:DUF1680 family protein
VGANASVKINGRTIEASPSPASYFTVARTWRNGDRITVDLPMYLHREVMPDEPTTQAFLYGPLVLAGKLGSDGLNRDLIVGPLGPEVRRHPIDVPQFRASAESLDSWLKPVPNQPLAFRTVGQEKDVSFVPFNRLFDERYSVYWTVS